MQSPAFRSLELALHNLVDTLESATDETAFKWAADHVARRVGFQWFAYLGFAELRLTVLSSYPRSWARHYLDQEYQRIDPVIGQARVSRRAFCWQAESARPHARAAPRFWCKNLRG